MNKFIISVIIFVCLATTSFGQQRFKAGVIIGLNASQINGDANAGFNKLGLMGGLRAAAILGPKSELGLEILYSQRGSQSDLIPSSGLLVARIRTSYVEVPVYYTFMDWAVEDLDYYRMHFHAGFSYGRLIEASTNVDEILTDAFNENDVAFIVGFTYNINENWGAGFRYNRSIIPLFKRSDDNPINTNTLWSFFLSFNTCYNF